MFTLKRLSILCLMVAFALGLTGCGSGNSSSSVKGKITFDDGTPLPEGTRVLFNPADGGNGTASGTTKADGSFELKQTKGGSGAQVGKYTVSLLGPEKNDDGSFAKFVPKSAADGSTLFAEVKPGGGTIELKIPKKTGK